MKLCPKCNKHTCVLVDGASFYMCYSCGYGESIDAVEEENEVENSINVATKIIQSSRPDQIK